MSRATALALASVLLTAPAGAQHNHDAGHPEYRNWVNGNGIGCCNNHDCGEVDDADVRQGAAAVEVRVDGEWCPVEPWMYLRGGNAPNWAVNHACVVPDSASLTDRRPCSRLICFQPKPGG